MIVITCRTAYDEDVSDGSVGKWGRYPGFDQMMSERDSGFDPFGALLVVFLGELVSPMEQGLSHYRRHCLTVELTAAAHHLNRQTQFVNKASVASALAKNLIPNASTCSNQFHV